ncbi:MAG: hypothetical protein LC130_12135 [Bryobacterales bacterium]|nr:hypothetical protein [Bryobacterales bacterium]
MFLFEQMFNNALNGIATAGLMSTVLTVAYGILLASLLFAAYEAWTRGGDVRALGVSAVKYLALGLLFANGGTMYDSAFRSVVGSFNQMAHAMAGVGPMDVLGAWLTEIRNVAFTSATLLNIVTGSVAGLLSALLLIVAIVLYPVAYTVFAVLYSLFGTILYVVGPLVLALMPAMGVGTLARRYAVNFVIFSAWGLLYGVLCRLTLALNIHSMAAIMGAGSFGGALQGAAAEVLLATASILFSVCILLIPFLAKRIVEGDLGATMLTVLGAAAAVVQSAVALGAGSGEGFGRAAGAGASEGGSGSAASGSSSVPPAAPSSPSAGNPAPTPATAGAASGGSQAPSGPGLGGGRGIGNWRPVNIPHAVGWLGGATAALGVQGAQRVGRAGRALISRAAAARSDRQAS